MKRITAVFTGFVGGMAPLLITVAHQLVEQTPGVPQKNVGQMIAGMLLFAAIGAFVVFAVGELELIKAFIQGIGAPAMISVYLQQAQAQGSLPSRSQDRIPAAKVETVPAPQPGASNRSDVGWSLLSSAFAQSAPSNQASIPNRVLEVKAKGAIHDITVNFLDAAGQSVGETTVQDAFARIVIPARATNVVFKKEASVASPADLPTEPGGVIYYEVTGTQGRKEFNLFSSVTGKAETLYTLSVEKIEINVLKPGAEGWAFVGRRANGDWSATYLNFDENNPEPNKDYIVQYYVTVLDKPGDRASRLGRLIKGQRVHVKEFRGYNFSESENNQFTKDGTYYAKVTVLSAD
jgi:hypothetical protein